MAALPNGNSKRKYSWWWDSHISPKNSKWLKENLTDMDVKVKQMIKLIEEDADSFARRAEMYYKKRPELMKLVEEFYRAYRALAERYENATGVIRHAHQTMAEVCPNQIAMMFGDESPVDSNNSEADPRTPEMPPPGRATIDPDKLQKNALGVSSSQFHAVKRNGAFTEEPDSVSNVKGLKQLNEFLRPGGGRARKGLNFHDGDEKGVNDESNRNRDVEARILSESEQVSKAEAEIETLKHALAKLEAEKEASLRRYEHSLERLSNLESEVSLAREDSKGLNERASTAEAEVQTLKETLSKLEFEKESCLLQYQQCLQKVADLESMISQAQSNAGEAAAEIQALKQALATLEAEKEAALVQYKHCLETISNLEVRLQNAEADVRRISERAGKAEGEIENLQRTISKLIEEKEASALQYQQCLDAIADLKLKLFHAQEEVQMLKREIEDGVAKLKVSEEKCFVLERSNQHLHSELDSLLQKLGNQSQELTDKQKEVGRLWTCVQEERLRFLEAETAFQTLQHLHSQSQEELRTLAAELQTRVQILEDLESYNSHLREQVQKVKDENKGLNELNLSSAASIKSMEDEISSLRETIQKLETEVELRVDQRNALQQEIYCLKEELGEINKKHQAMMDQVELVGFHPDCFGSSVKELQDENSQLKEAGEKEKSEKMALLEKLETLEKLVEKNILLENSMSDLSAELEAVRGKLKTLEEACQSLSEEKSILVAEKDTLVSRLQIAAQKSEELSEKNKVLENSLFDANAELEGLRIKLKSLEDSCFLLDSEKSGLISERESLVSQLDITRKILEDLEKGQGELKMKVLALERERESSLLQIEELGVSLVMKDTEYASLVQLSEARIGGMESQIHDLQEENQCREKEYQEVLDKGVNSQLEVFILQKCLQDLQEKSSSVMVEYQGIKEASEVKEKLISNLEHENQRQQTEIELVIARIKMLKMGLLQMLKRLEIDPELVCEDENAQDQRVMHDILNKLDNMRNMLLEVQDESQHSAIENFVLVALIRQLKSEAAELATEKGILDQEFRSRCQQLLSLQSETQKLIEMNEELRSKVKEGQHREELLKAEVENFDRQVFDLQGAFKNLQEENCKNLEEKRFLTNSMTCLEEEKTKLEEDILLLFSETMYQNCLSLIFKDNILDKALEINKLSEDLSRLQSINNKLEEKLREMEEKLNDAQTENSQLKGSLEESKSALLSVRSVNDQLTHELANGKDSLFQKEKELFQAMQMLSLVQDEKTELSKTLEDLRHRYDEIKMKEEEKEQHILNLSKDYDDQIKETGHVREVNQKFDAELQNLFKELEETKNEKEKLNHELLKERSEVELWESQAAAFFGDLQISAIHEALLQGKTGELNEAYGSLEASGARKDMEIDELKGRVSSLEDENRGLKSRMANYTQAVVLLNDSINSLDNCFLPGHKSEDQVTKAADSVTHLHAESHPQTIEDEFSDLRDMYLRVKGIEMALMEKEKNAMLENSNANAKLEAAMKQIEELKSGARRSKKKQGEHLRRPEHTREISAEESEVVTKDIMLDQTSDCSSYGRSWRGTQEMDEQTLELWETTGQSSGINLKLEEPHKTRTLEAVKENSKGKSLSEESFIIDKLEISERFSGPNDQSKSKVLERLDSDLQKLSNLKITVQDLKNKVDIDDKGKKGKGDEYDTAKGQLEEADEAIVKLLDLNRKLVKKVENGFVHSDGKSIDLDENQRGRRRRISELARRGSEKIGRLQMEIRRIQLLLLKLDGERESRANKSTINKTKISEGKTRVLLKDYIYGGRRGVEKKKRMSAFCACVRPPQSP